MILRASKMWKTHKMLIFCTIFAAKIKPRFCCFFRKITIYWTLQYHKIAKNCQKSARILTLAEKTEKRGFLGVPKSGKMPKIQIFVFLYNVFLSILSAIKVKYGKFGIVLGCVKHLRSCKTIISSV